MPAKRTGWRRVDQRLHADLRGREILSGENVFETFADDTASEAQDLLVSAITKEIDDKATEAADAYYHAHFSEEQWQEIVPERRRLIDRIKADVIEGMINLRSQYHNVGEALHLVGQLVRGSVTAYRL